MPAWWSPLSDRVQRLVGHGSDAVPGVPERPVVPAGEAALERPPQAWPWQPPVQRALDPTFAPRLRPDDFAAGLASHQDPTFRRDLRHAVEPSVGGLVGGLADVRPGSPRTQPPTSELTVRPVRSARPEVQRSLAPFAADGAVKGLTAVGLEAPWLVESGSESETTTAGVPAPAYVPPVTPRDVPLQRHEVDESPSVAPTETPQAAELPAMPVAPTVARTAGTRPTVSRAVPTDLARPLPVAPALPPSRPAPPELPVTRALPVLQRSAAPAGASSSSPAAPPPTTSSTGASSAEASATASLSGFAEAIERMSVPAVPDTAAVGTASTEPAVVGPVVPSGPAAVPGGADTRESGRLADAATPDLRREVQRDVVADAPAISGAVAPGGPEPGPPTAQRAAYDDLPVVHVARDAGRDERWGSDGVPRLPVVPPSSEPPSEPSSSPTGSPFGSHDAAAVSSRPAVVRTALSVARAVAADPGRTAPLTGTRPTLVQRSGPKSAHDLGAHPVERVQPLRYESSAAPTTRTSPTTTPTPSTSTTHARATTEPSRPADALPAVASGLTAPGLSAPRDSPADELEPLSVSRSADLTTRSTTERSAPRPASWDEQPRQRLATPSPASASAALAARPTPVRAMPFDQMFGGTDGTGGTGGSAAVTGWTTVDLPVVSDAPAIVQRAVETSEIATAPEPAPPLAPVVDAAPTAAAPTAAAPAAALSGAALDEMARRLFDPLSARLRAELWLDRERAGLVTDAHF